MVLYMLLMLLTLSLLFVTHESGSSLPQPEPLTLVDSPSSARRPCATTKSTCCPVTTGSGQSLGKGNFPPARLGQPYDRLGGRRRIFFSIPRLGTSMWSDGSALPK